MMTQQPINSNLIKEFASSKQTAFFESLKRLRFSGQVTLKHCERKQWNFCLYLGRVVYATGGSHSVRRYKRNLAIHMPEMVSELAIIESARDVLNFK